MVSRILCGFVLSITLASAALVSTALAQEPTPQAPTTARSPTNNIYFIGNSLTNDTLPALLGKGVEWHIDCGKNLKYIFENPKSPCVKTSVIWPEALKSRQYDILCVQPHFGTTLNEDVDVISKWLEMQPQADLVIHTGWNRSKDFESAYHAAIEPEKMVHAPRYFDMLTAELKEKFPTRRIVTTRAIEVLDEIYHDIQNSKASFQVFEDLYRDDIHLKHQSGRYLVHNLMRIALGKPLSKQGFQVEQIHQDYLDQKLHSALNAHLAQ